MQVTLNNFQALGSGWTVDNKPEASIPAGGTIPAGTASATGGHLNVTMGSQDATFNNKYRGDLKFNAGGDAGLYYTFNPTTDKYLAVKFIGDRPTGTLKMEFHSEGGTWFNRGGAKYTAFGTPIVTSNNNNIYYFILDQDATYTGTSDFSIDQINITIADITSGNTYVIDFIATFADLEAITTNKDMMDDGVSDSDEVALGVDDEVAKGVAFKLYPNPSTNNLFNIELKNNYSRTTATVKIYNLLGSLVLSKEVNTNTKKITVSHNLKAGLYIVELDNITSKLIVK